MISEPNFRDLIRDMPRIMGGVRPHLFKKHIEEAEWEGAREIADPFDDEKMILVEELIRLFWRPNRGEYSGLDYEIYDPRLIALYKELVPEYESLPNAHVNDGRFVKTFNILINAWIAYESASPVNLHSFYEDFQSYFSNSKQFASEQDVEESNASEGAPGSSSQHEELLTNMVKKQKSVIKVNDRNRRLLRGELTNSEIEKYADHSRFKNGRLNYTKFGKLLGLCRQSATKLIRERNLTHLLTPPA